MPIPGTGSAPSSVPVFVHVDHINCGTDCPFGGLLFDGRSKGLKGKLVCHCLVVETSQGLVLIDTGYGLKNVREA